MNQWDTFNDRTKDNPPRELYREAIELVPPGARCLDIAAGALVDTKDMLARGHAVYAFDANPSVVGLADSIVSSRLEVTIATMENFTYGKARFDYINAMFALSFISPESFNTTFQAITSSLKPGGILAFQLFGPGDDWYGNPRMTFHTKAQAGRLVRDLEVIKLKELRSMGSSSGSPKQWHTLQVIVKK